MEKFLPSNWVGESGAEMIANAVDTVLILISEDPNHQLRKNSDDVVGRLIIRLKTDPDFLESLQFLQKPHTDHEPGIVYPRITRSGFWQRS
jgi:uncharacterized membrane-anchored protein YjiN (DUF445 family)